MCIWTQLANGIMHQGRQSTILNVRAFKRMGQCILSRHGIVNPAPIRIWEVTNSTAKDNVWDPSFLWSYCRRILNYCPCNTSWSRPCTSFALCNSRLLQYSVLYNIFSAKHREINEESILKGHKTVTLRLLGCDVVQCQMGTIGVEEPSG